MLKTAAQQLTLFRVFAQRGVASSTSTSLPRPMIAHPTPAPATGKRLSSMLGAPRVARARYRRCMRARVLRSVCRERAGAGVSPLGRVSLVARVYCNSCTMIKCVGVSAPVSIWVGALRVY